MSILRTIICLLMAAVSLSAAPAPQAALEPFVPAGVWYGGGMVSPPAVAREPAKEKDAWRRDLAALASLGFNSVTAWANWPSAEPERGRYNLAALEQLLSLADELGLKVIVHVYTDAAPEWLGQTYTDAAYRPFDPGASTAQAVRGFCTDHPGIRSDLLAFIGAVARTAAGHRSFYAIDLRAETVVAENRAVEPPAGFCRCRHTLARLREWSSRTYGSPVEDGAAWAAFYSEKREEDLRRAGDAAKAHGARMVVSYSEKPPIVMGPPPGPGRDDAWRMASAVDYYGTRVHPRTQRSSWSPVTLMSTLDAMGSAAGARGWWLGELQAAPEPSSMPVTAADVRLWSWAAFSRGARSISYSIGPLDETAAGRLHAAGEVAGNLTRNVRLFAPMRARPSRVAVVLSPAVRAVSGNAAQASDRSSESALAFYKRMFERNIATDFIRVEDVLAGNASKYSVLYVGESASLPRPLDEALTAQARAGVTVIRHDPAQVHAIEDRIQHLVADAGVKPDIRIEGAPGLVEARFLESPDAFLLIALNHAETPQTVTLHFTPDTPEAIWQNMETGAAVHFVQRADGLTYRHAFGARDVLLLVRGKRLR